MNRLPSTTEIDLVSLIFKEITAACWYVDANKGVHWDENLYYLYDMLPGAGIDMEAFQDKVYKPDLERFNRVINEAMDQLIVFSVKIRIYIRGQYRWVLIKGGPDHKGGLLGVTQVIDDFYREKYETVQLLKTIQSLVKTGQAAYPSIVELLNDHKL